MPKKYITICENIANSGRNYLSYKNRPVYSTISPKVQGKRCDKIVRLMGFGGDITSKQLQFHMLSEDGGGVHMTIIKRQL